MKNSKSEISVTVVGSQSKKDADNVTNGLIELIKLFGGQETKFKLKLTIYCNDCKKTFRTFKALKVHMKKTGHKDKPK